MKLGLYSGLLIRTMAPPIDHFQIIKHLLDEASKSTWSLCKRKLEMMRDLQRKNPGLTDSKATKLLRPQLSPEVDTMISHLGSISNYIGEAGVNDADLLDRLDRYKERTYNVIEI